MDAAHRVRDPWAGTDSRPPGAPMIRWTGFVIAHRRRIARGVARAVRRSAASPPRTSAACCRTASACPASESERGLEPAQGPHGRPLGRRRSRSSPTGVDTPAERAAVVAGDAARRAGPCRAARPGRCCPPRRGRRLRPDRHAAREPGRVEGDAGAARARSATRRASRRTCPAIPAINHDTQKIFNEDLGARRVDRDPDRAARDGRSCSARSAGSSCRSCSRR